MDIQLKDLQLLELEIAKEIKRICEKNKIEYFIIDGTLLGAVRHGGFIPWDDDMDIGMTTSNYEKFLEIAPHELDSRFFLQTEKSDEKSGYIFAKVRLNHTHFYEAITDGLKIHNGIFVDIIPYDNASFEMTKSFHMKKLQLLCKLKMLKSGYKLNRITQKLSRKVINILLSMIPVPKTVINSMIEQEIKKASLTGNDYYIERDGMFKGTYVFKRDFVDELIPIQFENTIFMAPKNYDAFLTSAYGDYMVYPPEAERLIGHSVQGIELELPIECYFNKEASSE